MTRNRIQTIRLDCPHHTSPHVVAANIVNRDAGMRNKQSSPLAWESSSSCSSRDRRARRLLRRGCAIIELEMKSFLQYKPNNSQTQSVLPHPSKVILVLRADRSAELCPSVGLLCLEANSMRPSTRFFSSLIVGRRNLRRESYSQIALHHRDT